MIRTRALCISALFGVLVSANLQAEDMPSRQDRELIMSAVNIGMTEEQRLQFRDVITEFVQDYRSAMLKITRGHNATDLERKMEKKHHSLLKRLDTDMTGMLTAEQFQRYSDYRHRLEARLTQRGSSEPDDYMNWEIPPATHH